MGARRVVLAMTGGWLILTSTLAWADRPEDRDQLQVDLRYRLENEYHFNLKYYGPDPPQGSGDDTFLLQRVRLIWRYDLGRGAFLSVGLQDSRAVGLALPDEIFFSRRLGLPNNPYRDYLEPFDTYLQLEHLLGDGLTLKVGRQTITQGDSKIFGPGQWGNTGRFLWDAARVSYHWGQANWVDTFWGAHMIHEPDRLSWTHRHNFSGAAVYAHFSLAETVHLEPVAVLKYDGRPDFSGESGRGDYNGYFLGGRIYGRLAGGLRYDGTYVRQWGNYAADDIAASGAHFLLEYSASSLAGSPAVSLEYSYGSGDSDPHDGTRETFNNVFGSRDRSYGRMNLFDWSNLEDLQANLSFRPGRRLSARAELHDFHLGSDRDGWSLNPGLYRDPTGAAGDDVGREVDLISRWDVPLAWTEGGGRLRLEAGYGRFFPGRFTRQVAADTQAGWFFWQCELRVVR